MYGLTQDRWRMEPVRIHRLVGQPILDGRRIAEQYAESDPYIFCDDDILIMGRNWTERACDILLRNPDYAIVSTLSMIEGENRVRPENEDCEIYPMHAVGQPMLIRKGICVDLPEMTLASECGTLHKHVLDRGKQMGLLWGGKEPLRHMHLGHGFSSNPLLHWGF